MVFGVLTNKYLWWIEFEFMLKVYLICSLSYEFDIIKKRESNTDIHLNHEWEKGSVEPDNTLVMHSVHKVIMYFVLDESTLI